MPITDRRIDQLLEGCTSPDDILGEPGGHWQTAIVARGDEWLPPQQLCARDGGYPNMAMTHRVFALWSQPYFDLSAVRNQAVQRLIGVLPAY